LLGSDGPIFYLARLGNFGDGIAKDRSEASGLSVCVDECATFNVVVTFPADCEVGFGFLEVDGLGVPISGKSCSEVVGGVQHPGISSLGRKEHQRTDGDKAGIVFSRPALNVFDLLGEPKLALHPVFARSSRSLERTQKHASYMTNKRGTI